MRRTTLALTAIAAAASPALAKDSTWLVCKGVAEHGAAPDADKTFFVANVLEHRAPSGSDRELRVTLIYGDRASRGVIAKAEPNKAGKLETRDVDGKRGVIFSGTGQLDEAMTSFAITGKLDETYGDAKPDRRPLRATLTCEALDDQAIGR
jgi:hypothetical protein